MPLAPGTRLGAYEILSFIDEGGMGKVYRASDTRLKRDVAIKVLPESFAAEPERLARFQREAEVLASLNHLNIAHVYGLEQADGVQALVMELVEGPTLADRIAQGPIQVDEALAIAKQIAEALEAAHERGIIHRDLKPANIKVRKDGTVKVLDFGLAKAIEPTSGSRASATMSPTITSPAMTGVGVLLGTAAYMAPEQARGKTVDKLTDIWAFGCVLYEMLTGKRAFPGEDVSETLATVIKGEPDWNRLPANTHGAVRRLLRRCLQKNPHERLHDISDARLEIQEAQTTPDREVTIIPTPASVHRRERVAWTLLALATLALVALAVPATLYVRRTVPEPVITRLDVVTPPTPDAFSFALSPDGRQLVFVANGEKGSQLWLRPLDQTTLQPLANTEGALYPFWAPDGRAVGFFADGKLKRINLTDGAVQVLADAPVPRGGTWNVEDIIVFAPATNGALMRVAARGGVATPVTQVASGQGSHRWPQFLPDGRRFLFSMATGLPPTHGAYIGSLDGGNPTRVMSAETAAAYAAPGYLLLVSQGVLSAYPFDTATGTVATEPIPLAQSVGTDDGALHSAFSVSEQGVLAHRVGGGTRRQLAWLDRRGELMVALGSVDENALANPELAPNGQRVALNRSVEGNVDIWLLEAGRGVPSRFTFDAGLDSGAIWSPDGSQLVFRSTRKGSYDLFQKPASGAVDEQALFVTPEHETPLDWSHDGHLLLYSVQNPKTASDIWALPLVGERKPFAVLQSTFDEIQGQLSPDGRWLAYVSNESGRYEIYIRTFPKVGGKWQVSGSGGMQPRWRPDGRELFYVAPDTRLMAVTLRLAPNADFLGAVDTPVALFPTRLATGGNIPTAGAQARAQYAVAPDGRFLLNMASDNRVTAPITIVHNWTAGLTK
jgi:serine/threonine protein kinase/Tol biopolymer transport system component